MKKKLTLFLLLFTVMSAFSQGDKSIKEIYDNPGKYLDLGFVTIEGTVTRYVPAPTEQARAYYLIKGDYDHELMVQVRTGSDSPVVNQRYKVEGFLNLDKDQKPIVSETKRTLVRTAASPPQPAREMAPTPPVQTTPVKADEPDYLLYIIIGIGALLILLIIVVIATKKPKQQPIIYDQMPTRPITQLGTGSGSAPETVVSSPSNRLASPTIASQGFTTVRFESAPKTMRFIPGKFTITTQEDKGKAFQIAGYPSQGGAVVTIGREEVKGDRSFAHIKIDDKFRTVSRKQAELNYGGGSLYVINKSSSNPTQVDGYQLGTDEKREVKSGSVIRMGELEFLYSV